MMRWWYGPMDGWGAGFGILGMIMMILFWVLIAWAIVALVRYLFGSREDRERDNRPLEILKERYAKGEIDKKEFEERKKELS